MKSPAEYLLLKLPIFLQNVALSAYGLKVQYIRYGGAYNTFFKAATTRLNLELSKLEEYCNTMLQNIVHDAVTYVPYYSDLFKKNGLTPGDIRTVDVVEKIPLLSKDVVRRSPELFINGKYKKRKLHTIYTTGTTGTPLTIYCNSEVRQRNYAFYSRFLRMNGFNEEGKRATFGGRIVVPPEQKAPPFWRYSRFQKNLLFSSYHLTERNIPAYIEQLKSFGPDYIDTYPSSIFAIANYVVKNNLDLRGVTQGITTSGETLFSNQRDIIESAFGVHICDQSGASEMFIFVSQ